MSYFHGSAATFDDVMEHIENFASADGWTINSRSANALNLSKFGSTWDFTRRFDNQNMWNGAGTTSFQEFMASIRLRRDVEGSTSYSQEARANDMAGPFSNVWIFSDENKRCINVVLQTASDRYGHFGIGVLDPRGMHSEDVAYVISMFWFWWRDRENYSNNNGPFNWPQDGNHGVGYFGDRNECHVAIPGGLLDATLSFRAGGWVTDNQRSEPPRIWRTCTRYYGVSQGSENAHGYMLDFFMAVDNQAQTGGIPLSALPCIVYGTDGNNAKAYLGEYQDVRLVNMSGLQPAQSVTFAGDEWVVFPLKQLGSISAAYGQLAPQPYCNSIYYGLAYRKVS